MSTALLRLMAIVRDLSLFVKFLGLLAGRTGQLLNLSQVSNDAGVSHTTARQWLSPLEAGFIVHLLGITATLSCDLLFSRWLGKRRTGR